MHMKKLLLFLISLPFIMFAQSPQGVGYQGVATDLNGVELINQTISIQASVLSSSATGNVEWQEEHSVTTDAFGLFTLTIGQGTSTGNGIQANFADISWGSATHFLKIEMDVNGGTNYSLMGTNQMMSVPYALYAENANINYDSIATILSNDSIFTNSFNLVGNMVFGDEIIVNPLIENQAPSDGFLYSKFLLNASSSAEIRLHCDIFSGNTTIKGNWSIPNGGPERGTFTIPIRKDEYYSFFIIGGSSLTNTYFLPLESGGSSTSSLDSTTIANMIAAAGGGSSNLKFPDGVDGEFLTVELCDDNQNTNPYTVPSGKTLYVTSALSGIISITSDNLGTSEVIFNGSNGGSNSYDRSLNNPIILKSGQVISGYNNTNESTAINGFLVDNGATPITWGGTGPTTTYTVPVGKKLYITHSYGDKIEIDNVKIDGAIGAYFLGQPILVDENQIVTARGNAIFNGYLVDNNHFSNSGGNNNSSSLSDSIYTGYFGFAKTRYVDGTIPINNFDTIVLPYEEGKVLYLDGKNLYNNGLDSSWLQSTGFNHQNLGVGSSNIFALRITDENFNVISAKITGSCEANSSIGRAYYDINQIYSFNGCQNFSLEVIPKNNNTGVIYIFIEHFVEPSNPSLSYSEFSDFYYQY